MSLTDAQRAERATRIGGSDCAAVLGVSKWKTALELYLEKRGEFSRDEIEETEPQWWGKMLEPIVRQRYSDLTNRVVRLPKETLHHPVHDFIVAHVDGITDDGRGYEGKTAMRSIDWGEEGTDSVPRDALLQTHHYMAVTGLPVFDIATLIGRRFALYEVHQDLEIQEMIVEAEVDFMRRVREGEPPSLDYDHRTARDVIKKLHPGTNGARLTASEAAIGWRTQLEAAQAAEKAAKANIESLKSRLLEEMGEAALLAYPDGKAHRRQLTQRAGYTVEPTEFMDFRIINDGKAAALKQRSRSTTT